MTQTFKFNVTRAKLSIMLIFLLFVSVASWYGLSYIKDSFKYDIQKSLHTVLMTTQEALGGWLIHHKAILNDIVDRPEITHQTEKLILSYINQEELVLSPHLKVLRKIMETPILRYNMKGFFVIAPDGTSIASMRNTNIQSQNLIAKDHPALFNQILRGNTVLIPPMISDVPLSNKDSDVREAYTTMFIATPILDKSSRVIAVLALRIDPLVDFFRIIQLGRIGDTGETYAFDDQARLLTKSRFKHQLISIGEIQDRDTTVLSVHITDPGGNLITGYGASLPIDARPLTYMAQHAIEGSSHAYIESYRDYRGVPVFGAWTWDKALGIGLTTEIDEEEVLHPFHEVQNIFFIIMATTVILSFLLVSLLFSIEKKGRRDLKHAYSKLQGAQEEIKSTSNELEQHKNELENTVRIRTEELEQLNRKLKRLSEIDPLTNVANRRAYEVRLLAEYSLLKRVKKPLSLMVIDIDHFKEYNDNYGHDQGDEVLRRVAQLIKNALPRDTDFLARYGGEEFVVLMPSTNAEGVSKVAERIRSFIEVDAIEHQYSSVSDVLTVSIGISTSHSAEITKIELFQLADKALYQAKECGRNRVEVLRRVQGI